MTYRDAPPLVGRLSGEVSLVSVSSLNPQETVGGVADAAGQNAVSQHGVDHGAFPVTGPVLRQRPGQTLPSDQEQFHV